MFILPQLEGFDWDRGNLDKNWRKHRVSNAECEEIFFNQPLFLHDDPAHSQAEKRHYALGKTDAGRVLFISFTLRNNKIRIISSRDASGRERKSYIQ